MKIHFLLSTATALSTPVMMLYQSKTVNGFTIATTTTTFSTKTHHNSMKQTRTNLPLAHDLTSFVGKQTTKTSYHHHFAVAFDTADIPFPDDKHENSKNNNNNDGEINFSLQQQQQDSIQFTSSPTDSVIQAPPQQHEEITNTSTTTSSTTPPLSVWKRRLITKEDKFGLHKMSGIGQTLSALTIFGIGATSGFQELPSILEPFTAIFCLSMLVQCITSFNLAESHRKLEPTVGNVFKNMGLSTLVIAISSYWIAPFAPNMMNDPIISKSMYSVFSLFGVYLGLDAIMNIDTLTATQTRHDKYTANEFHKWSRAFVTIVPYLFTIPFNLVVFYTLGYQYDRQSFVDLLFSTSGVSAESIYYESIFSALGISFLALYVTLRDKKLISKDTEILLTLLTAIPVIFVNFDQSRALLQPLLSQYV